MSNFIHLIYIIKYFYIHIYIYIQIYSTNSLSNSNDGDIDSLGQSGKNQDSIFYRNQSSQHSQTINKNNVSFKFLLL